ncbi:hypothetical protein JAF83_001766 [Citrobacter werkmanii]|nr:hypothetical protein [Citrobacter werkmanii]
MSLCLKFAQIFQTAMMSTGHAEYKKRAVWQTSDSLHFNQMLARAINRLFRTTVAMVRFQRLTA